jgi:hypothetical protein
MRLWRSAVTACSTFYHGILIRRQMKDPSTSSHHEPDPAFDRSPDSRTGRNFDFCETPSVLETLDQWIRRKLATESTLRNIKRTHPGG